MRDATASNTSQTRRMPGKRRTMQVATARIRIEIG
jgi:hypothetical protein